MWINTLSSDIIKKTMSEGGISTESKNRGAEAIKSFKTAQGSIYTYDEEGKTTRYKSATKEQYSKQDITVFVDLSSDEEQRFLHAYQPTPGVSQNEKVYVLERQDDDTPKIIRDRKKVQNPDKLYLGIVKKGQVVFTKKASLAPHIGYNVFDTRRLEKDGEWFTERHIGNKVVEINEN